MKIMVFDVGGTEIKYSVMDEKMHRTDSGAVPTPQDTQAQFLDTVYRLYAPHKDEVNGIAMALPPMLYWSVDTCDWECRDVQKVFAAICQARDGDVILLHDCYASSVKAALAIIDILKSIIYSHIMLAADTCNSVTNDFFEFILNILTDNKNHLVKSGFDCIMNRIIHNDMSSFIYRPVRRS